MAMTAATRKKLEKQSAAAQKKADKASRKIPAACGHNLTGAAAKKKAKSAKCKALKKTVNAGWATVTRNRKKIHSSGHRYSNVGLRSGYVD